MRTSAWLKNLSSEAHPNPWIAAKPAPSGVASL